MLKDSSRLAVSAVGAICLLSVASTGYAQSTVTACGNPPNLDEYWHDLTSERFMRLSNAWSECNSRETKRLNAEAVRKHQEERARVAVLEEAADAAKKARETFSNPIASKIQDNFGEGKLSKDLGAAVSLSKGTTTGAASKLSRANPLAGVVTKRNVLSSIEVMKSAVTGFESAISAAPSSTATSAGWSSNASYSAPLGPAPQTGGYDARLEAGARQAEYGQIQYRQAQEAERRERLVDRAEAQAQAREERLAAERALTPYQRQMREYEKQQRAAVAAAQASLRSSGSSPSARSSTPNSSGKSMELGY